MCKRCDLNESYRNKLQMEHKALMMDCLLTKHL